MKILQLCPRTPFPPDDGGRISMYNVTRHLLQEGTQLTMLSYHDAPESDEQHEILGKSFRFICLQHSTRNSPLRIVASLFQNTALYLHKHNSAAILKRVLELFPNPDFDCIHADHTAMAPLAEALSLQWNIPFALRLHNVEYKIWQRYAERLPAWHPKRWYVQSQASKLARDESAYIKKARWAFPISETDAAEARQMAPGANVVTINAGVNSSDWAVSDSQQRAPHDIVMASAWSWQHNVDGAMWFLTKVFPDVKSQMPGVRLHIPGSKAPELFARFTSDSVLCPGYVDQMPPVYQAASLFVVPLFVGSGVRIKIVEAMAAGLVVVATTVGAEGIEATEEHGLFRCDSAEEQRQKILQLLADQDTLRSLQRAAAKRAREHYEWSVQIKKIYDLYATLAKN